MASVLRRLHGRWAIFQSMDQQINCWTPYSPCRRAGESAGYHRSGNSHRFGGSKRPLHLSGAEYSGRTSILQRVGKGLELSKEKQLTLLQSLPAEPAHICTLHPREFKLSAEFTSATPIIPCNKIHRDTAPLLRIGEKALAQFI